MKVLFFNPEQYVSFEQEPSNVQLRLPILNCDLPIIHRDHVYQRDLRAHGRAEMDRRALAAVADFRPDVVVYSATWEHENLSPGVLGTIRDGGTPVVAMLWDSWVEPTTAEAELLANCTVLVVGDSLHTYLRCRLTGAALTPAVKVAFFGGQVFTDLVRQLPDEPKCYDVTLLGSNEGERRHLVGYLAAELPKHGITFNKAGGLVDSDKGAFALTDGWVSWEEYVRIVNRSRLGLNTRTDPTRLQIKGKIFDYLACGVPCLTDTNVETRRFFPEGTVAVFDGPEDCIAQIRRLLDDETELCRLAGAGRRWLMETFGYKAFWSGVLRAALGEEHALPTLPLLEDAFAGMAAGRNRTLRRDLTTGARLAELGFMAPEAHRVPAIWMGRREDGFHRIALEGGGWVATNRMPAEILRDCGRRLLLSDAFGLVCLEDGWVFGRSGAAAVFATEPERLDRMVADLLRQRSERIT